MEQFRTAGFRSTFPSWLGRTFLTVAGSIEGEGRESTWHPGFGCPRRSGSPETLVFLLCFLQRRKLDAVYYYMRSLAASNPILTAKESLMSLFEETKRKVSLAAGLWGAAPLLCCRAWRECWLLDFPTSKKFQERGSLQNDGFGVVWAAESLVFESQTDLAELYKGCWLLGFAAWPWHVAQCLLYSIDAPYPILMDKGGCSAFVPQRLTPNTAHGLPHAPGTGHSFSCSGVVEVENCSPALSCRVRTKLRTCPCVTVVVKQGKGLIFPCI